MSVLVECPTCGASIEEIGREWRAHDAGLCKRLAGTKYLNQAQFPDVGTIGALTYLTQRHAM
jgi:hypothetical protein